MKKIVLLLAIGAISAFGYNFNGTWINKNAASYNEPTKLVISDNKITPTINRGAKKATLKTKYSTDIGNGLFEAWGIGYTNLALVVKPINSYKLKVVAKKIDTKRKKISTKNYIFTKKGALNKNFKKRFIGNFRSIDGFSALKKITIREINGKLYVNALKRGQRGIRDLGSSRATIKNNRLYTTYKKGNLVVNLTIKGFNYNKRLNRYNNLEVYLKAKNLRNGMVNTQTIELRRGNIRVPSNPFINRGAIRPIFNY